MERGGEERMKAGNGRRESPGFKTWALFFAKKAPQKMRGDYSHGKPSENLQVFGGKIRCRDSQKGCDVSL